LKNINLAVITAITTPERKCLAFLYALSKLI